MRCWSMVAVAVLAAAACVAAPEPVPVIGAAADIRALVGRWEGDYHSAATGRSGSIVFELTAEGDTARGEVVMIPRGWSEPLRAAGYRPGAEPGDPTAGRAQPELLTIEFVRVADGRVSGTLTPYRDPECGCTLLTAFVGRMEGRGIEGTFTSRHAATGRTESGRWKVTRKDS